MRQLLISLVFIAILSSSNAWAQQRFNVAILQDGPVEHELIPLDLLEQEIELLLGQDQDVSFILHQSGDWSLAGNKQLLEQTLAHNDVDVIVTMGLLGSAAAADLRELSKPVVSVLVGDVEAQDFPKAPDGSSGKRNFAYIDDSLSIASELTSFHQVTSFRHVAVFADAAWLEAFPSLEALARRPTELVPLAQRFPHRSPLEPKVQSN